MNEMGHIGVDIIRKDILNMENENLAKLELNNRYERIIGKIEMLFELELISELLKDRLSYKTCIIYQSKLYKIINEEKQ